MFHLIHKTKQKGGALGKHSRHSVVYTWIHTRSIWPGRQQAVASWVWETSLNPGPQKTQWSPPLRNPSLPSHPSLHPPVPPGLPQASRYLLFFWVTASLVSNSAALSCCARCFFTQRDLDAQHVTDVTILTQISVWPCDFFKSQEKMKENSVSVSLLSPYLFILWWYLLCLSVGRQRSWRGRPGCCDKLRNTFI